LDYLFAFSSPSGTSLALLSAADQPGLAEGEIIVSPGKFLKQSAQVPFLSGEMAPVSGIWRIDHTRCPNAGDIWLHNQMPFPPCPGCGCPARYSLVEEIRHISEDSDFQ
jgi:hypothetical protein